MATEAGLLTETFGWDWLNRLTSLSGTVNATYTYDYQSRRATKAVGSTTTTYIYDGLKMVQEKNGTPAVVAADYLYGPGLDDPIAMKRGGSVYYYMVDGLGSRHVGDRHDQ